MPDVAVLALRDGKNLIVGHLGKVKGKSEQAARTGLTVRQLNPKFRPIDLPAVNKQTATRTRIPAMDRLLRRAYVELAGDLWTNPKVVDRT